MCILRDIEILNGMVRKGLTEVSKDLKEVKEGVSHMGILLEEKHSKRSPLWLRQSQGERGRR